MKRLVYTVNTHRVTVSFHGWLVLALPIHMDDNDEEHVIDDDDDDRKADKIDNDAVDFFTFDDLSLQGFGKFFNFVC